jgi:hypothetical protein
MPLVESFSALATVTGPEGEPIEVTPTPPPTAAQPGAPASAVEDVDVKSMDDAELKELQAKIAEERKSRREENRVDLPQPGDRVTINVGPHQGKTGRVVKSGKTRCWVAVEGAPVPLYLGLNDFTLEGD